MMARRIRVRKDFIQACRRRYKSGIVAGTKAERELQGKSGKNGGPNVGWRMFDDPELELRVVDEGNGGFGSAGDLVIAALEIDGVVVVDATLLAKGKVQVEQCLSGGGAEALGAGQQGVFPDAEGDEAGAALAGAVLALELHLEELVGVPRGGDFGVGKEGDDAALAARP